MSEQLSLSATVCQYSFLSVQQYVSTAFSQCNSMSVRQCNIYFVSNLIVYLPYLCIISVLSLHYLCIISALSLHYLCTISALSLHYLCIVNNRVFETEKYRDDALAQRALEAALVIVDRVLTYARSADVAVERAELLTELVKVANSSEHCIDKQRCQLNLHLPTD